MGRSALIILGILAFALLAFLCINADRFRIESVVENNAKAAVSYLDEPNLRIEADGRDITLSGVVSSQNRREQIIDIVRNTEGVRVVRDEIGGNAAPSSADEAQALAPSSPVVPDAQPTPSTPSVNAVAPPPQPEDPSSGQALGELGYQNGVLSLTGEVPSEAARQALNDLPAAYGIEQDITVSVNPAVDNALVDSAKLLAEMSSEAESLRVNFEPNQATLQGKVYSAPARDELNDRFSAIAGEREPAVSLEVIDPPVQEEAETRAELNSAAIPAISNAPEGMVVIEQEPPSVITEAPASAVVAPAEPEPEPTPAVNRQVIASTAPRDTSPLLFDDCQLELNKAIEASRIEFQNRTNVLTPPSVGSLRNLVGLVRRCPSSNHILIAGHTDSRGEREMNLRLSLARAQAVAEYFASQGVNPVRLQTIGFGESRPIDSNNAADGRQRNRRIEITLLKSEG